MGLITLAEYTEDIHAKLKDSGVREPMMIRWVNMAYQEVAGAIRFEELMADPVDVSLDDGDDSFDVPTGLLAPVGLYLSNSEGYEFSPLRSNIVDFLRQSNVTEGIPTRWVRRGAKIYVRPVADQAYTGHFIYTKEPAALAASSSTTVLPSQWDGVIYLLAISLGCAFYERWDAADRFYQRAMITIKSRTTANELLNQIPQPAGLQVAQSAADLSESD